MDPAGRYFRTMVLTFIETVFRVRILKSVLQ